MKRLLVDRWMLQRVLDGEVVTHVASSREYADLAFEITRQRVLEAQVAAMFAVPLAMVRPNLDLVRLGRAAARRLVRGRALR